MLNNKYDSAIIKLLIPKTSTQIALIEKAILNGLDWESLKVEADDLYSLKLKSNKLPQNMLAYVRSYLIIKTYDNPQLIKVSQPCVATFEVRVLDCAIAILKAYYTTRFTTTIESDMNELSKGNMHYRLKFAVIYRLCKKRIIIRCLRYLCVLQGIMKRIESGVQFKEAYLKLLPEFEDQSEFIQNRRALRKYLQLFNSNQKALFKK